MPKWVWNPRRVVTSNNRHILLVSHSSNYHEGPFHGPLTCFPLPVSKSILCGTSSCNIYLLILFFRPLIPSLQAQDSYQDKNNNMFCTMRLNMTHVPILKHLEHMVTFPLRDIFPCGTQTMKVGSKILYISRRMWTFLNLHN